MKDGISTLQKISMLQHIKYAYENFQQSYYGKDHNEPATSIGEFFHNPLFVIDCSHQSDAIKSSTVDIKLEFQTRKNKFPKDTKVYALILHDSCVSYNALDGSVQNKIISTKK